MDDRLVDMFRSEIPFIMLGTIILAIGLSSLIVYFMRWNSREKLSLWLGLFAGLYGIRLLIGQSIVNAVFDQSEITANFLNSFINYLIFVPALLFFGELYGKGWRNSFNWIVRGATIYLFMAVLSDLVRRQPYSVPDPAVLTALPLALVAGLGFYRGYQPPRTFKEIRPVWIGYLLFLVFVAHEHLSQNGFLPWKLSIEPVGFLLFTFCLGYVAVRRFFTNEQQLVAIETEMRAARQIQSAILPARAPCLPELQIAVRYEPMTSVAGDFYDFLVIDEKRIGLLVADVTGHGVPAALIASMVKVCITSQASYAPDPARFIAGLNDVLCQTLRGQMVTAAYLFIDLDNMSAIYSGAGHPPLLVFRKSDRRLLQIEQNGLPLGFIPDAEYSNVEFELQPGDRILLYTDGLTEATNGSEEQFGEIRLGKCIEDHSHLATADFADLLLREAYSWAGRNGVKSQADDLTLLVADVKIS